MGTLIHPNGTLRGRLPGISWRELVSVTGADAGAEETAIVSGLLVHGAFLLERSVSARLDGELPPERALVSLARRHRVPLSRFSVAIPRRLLAARYYTLPSQDPEELAAMLAHQLSLDLPLDVGRVSWASGTAETHADGSATLLVHLLRQDHLASHLQPFRAAGIEIERAIPEGSVLAHLLGRVLGEGEKSVLVARADTLHYIVERGGTLLYHRAASRSLTESGAAPDAGWAAEETRAASSEFATCLHRMLPEPLHVVNLQAERGAWGSSAEAFAHCLAEETGLEVVLVPPIESAAGAVPRAPALAEETSSRGAKRQAGRTPLFALALAEVSARNLHHSQGLRMDALRRSSVERNGVLFRTALAIGFTCLMTVLGATTDLRILGGKLRSMEKRLAASFPGGLPVHLLAQNAARLAPAPVDPLQGLAAIQAAAPPSLKLQQFTYSQRGTVALQGTTLDLASAMDFWQRLSEDTVWAEVRLLGLYRTSGQREAPFRFEIEGRLALSRRASDLATRGRSQP